MRKKKDEKVCVVILRNLARIFNSRGVAVDGFRTGEGVRRGLRIQTPTATHTFKHQPPQARACGVEFVRPEDVEIQSAVEGAQRRRLATYVGLEVELGLALSRRRRLATYIVVFTVHVDVEDPAIVVEASPSAYK